MGTFNDPCVFISGFIIVYCLELPTLTTHSSNEVILHPIDHMFGHPGSLGLDMHCQRLLDVENRGSKGVKSRLPNK